MPETAESYQLVWAVLLLLTFAMLLSVNSTQKKRKKLSKDIRRKKSALAKRPVEDIVQELKLEIGVIESKTANGRPVYARLKEELVNKEEQLKYINVGLFPPTYRFDDSQALKDRIAGCLDRQYQVIKSGRATSAYTNWDWFGSESKGARMVTSYQSLLLKAFNAEFDMIRKKMRHSSYETALNKLDRLELQLEKLGETANVAIAYEYFDLKAEELTIWHSELLRKEKIKQEKKKQQALLREQAKLAKRSLDDIDDLEDEIYYKNSDLVKAQKLAKELHGASSQDMEQKIAHMKEEIEKLETKFERATSQAQLTKAGYIYVISNIGSFGEGVVKIGMTRRLEPMDRVNELGDASVPFKFDVHALTFVDDAPRIERELHREFDGRRVNGENRRKEFFKVSPPEVAKVMRELRIDCDWYYEVEAKEYRESQLIREARKQEAEEAQSASSQFPQSI
ncbi:DUF4041 domain-containing protein [Vibrio superstes]|uniref:Bacteriophage T5 Orf172 DNA-binding domain-containing protein n=1 Tax=Vibrio superstes NBRC 103154 TaxID=1219062 RepID=A0A511QMX0_9VIBR|nr:DUF4041 domain-containing protein [Vibrio superstes]GEM78497.1 hypothetical protein VSU01S_07420 [Vibrio superstes NBRC 103154]